MKSKKRKAEAKVANDRKTSVGAKRRGRQVRTSEIKSESSGVGAGVHSASGSTYNTTGDKCFNREKLKQILKCLADQQQQERERAQVKEDHDGTVPEIFNRERLNKINTGLLNPSSRTVDGDNDSDCCVVFDGKRHAFGDGLSTAHSDVNIPEVHVIDTDDDGDDYETELLAEKRKCNGQRQVPKIQMVVAMAATTSAPTDNPLKEQMMAKLNAARFRFINEKLYTSSGADAQVMFSKDPEAYRVYHAGYQTQLSKWPVRPLDLIVKGIKNMPKSKVIADFGCGDATLSRSVTNKVHSFDLVALNDRVHACNMDKVPLKDSSVDLAVFCLSLMGTNLPDYIAEANRVLKMGGLLKIAEVRSRFGNVRKFQDQMNRFGFKFLKKDATNKMFIMLDFKKNGRCDKLRRGDLPRLSLQPCMYKRR